MNPTPLALPPSFSSTDFRAALSTFATGVTVITARDETGVRVGLTANSFNSVSLAPPLVLWSLSRKASTMPAFSRGSHYAINILSAEQQALAMTFASKDTNRWAGIWEIMADEETDGDDIIYTDYSSGEWEMG